MSPPQALELAAQEGLGVQAEGGIGFQLVQQLGAVGAGRRHSLATLDGGAAHGINVAAVLLVQPHHVHDGPTVDAKRVQQASDAGCDLEGAGDLQRSAA